MTTPEKQPYQTDYITTEARLRGLRTLSFNQQILKKQRDLAQLTELLTRHNIQNSSSVIELKQQLDAMNDQVRKWLELVNFDNLDSDYVVTIVLEEVKQS